MARREDGAHRVFGDLDRFVDVEIAFEDVGRVDGVHAGDRRLHRRQALGVAERRQGHDVAGARGAEGQHIVARKVRIHFFERRQAALADHFVGFGEAGSSDIMYFGRYTSEWPPSSAGSTIVVISITAVSGTQVSVMFVT